MADDLSAIARSVSPPMVVVEAGFGMDVKWCRACSSQHQAPSCSCAMELMYPMGQLRLRSSLANGPLHHYRQTGTGCVQTYQLYVLYLSETASARRLFQMPPTRKNMRRGFVDWRSRRTDFETGWEGTQLRRRLCSKGSMSRMLTTRFGKTTTVKPTTGERVRPIAFASRCGALVNDVFLDCRILVSDLTRTRTFLNR